MRARTHSPRPSAHARRRASPDQPHGPTPRRPRRRGAPHRRRPRHRHDRAPTHATHAARRAPAGSRARRAAPDRTAGPPRTRAAATVPAHATSPAPRVACAGSARAPLRWHSRARQVQVDWPMCSSASTADPAGAAPPAPDAAPARAPASEALLQAVSQELRDVLPEGYVLRTGQAHHLAALGRDEDFLGVAATGSGKSLALFLRATADALDARRRGTSPALRQPDSDGWPRAPHRRMCDLLPWHTHSGVSSGAASSRFAHTALPPAPRGAHRPCLPCPGARRDACVSTLLVVMPINIGR